MGVLHSSFIRNWWWTTATILVNPCLSGAGTSTRLLIISATCAGRSWLGCLPPSCLFVRHSTASTIPRVSFRQLSPVRRLAPSLRLLFFEATGSSGTISIVPSHSESRRLTTEYWSSVAVAFVFHVILTQFVAFRACESLLSSFFC